MKTNNNETWQDRFDKLAELPRKLDVNGVNIGGFLSTGGRLFDADVKSFISQELQQARKERDKEIRKDIYDINNHPPTFLCQDGVSYDWMQEKAYKQACMDIVERLTGELPKEIINPLKPA